MNLDLVRHNADDPAWEMCDIAAKNGDIEGLLKLYKGLAARGEASLYAQIGEIYERGGPGVSRDGKEAAANYTKGVDFTDDPSCHVGLGRTLLLGHGVSKDLKTAFAHFTSANLQGNNLARLYLGRMHYFGLGVSKDLDRAQWFLESLLSHEYVSAYILLSRIMFKKGKFIQALKLNLKGHKLGSEILKSNPTDHRLL